MDLVGVRTFLTLVFTTDARLPGNLYFKIRIRKGLNYEIYSVKLSAAF